jgi:hypothetical protein
LFDLAPAPVFPLHALNLGSHGGVSDRACAPRSHRCLWRYGHRVCR